jgi:hypothetical protein
VTCLPGRSLPAPYYHPPSGTTPSARNPQPSVYELRPLPYAEVGYGYPESGQTMINVTNGKLISLLANDEPLDVRYGELRAHERCLGLSRRREPLATQG